MVELTLEEKIDMVRGAIIGALTGGHLESKDGASYGKSILLQIADILELNVTPATTPQTNTEAIEAYIERFVPPGELRVGDLFYPHSDLPTNLSEFQTAKDIWARANGTYDVYVADQSFYSLSSYGVRTLTLAPHGNIRPANALVVGDRCMPAYTNDDFVIYREITGIKQMPSLGIQIQFFDGDIRVHPMKLYRVETFY